MRIDEVVTKYLDERKVEWLKKRIKASMTEEEKTLLQEEADTKFNLANWMTDAANRAGQMSISTHPCTFSHPSSRKNKNGTETIYVTPVVSESRYTCDGLLRSGNVEVQKDALGNAAALDVYKFLTLKLTDGRELVDHVLHETEQAKAIFSGVIERYDEVRDGLLAMLKSEVSQDITSSKIKQVYFPIEEETYHLLSILTPSGIVFALKERIDEMRFSQRSKSLREIRRKGECSEEHYMDLFDLSVTGYGGTKPQNVSVLNNRYGGRAYLLRSMPPMLKKRNIKFPKKDFFTESLYLKMFVEELDALVKLTGQDYNNVKIREGRKRRYRRMVEKIIERMWQMRSVSGEQYFETTSRLPEWQVAWLVPESAKAEDTGWKEKVHRAITHWMTSALEQKVGKDFFLGIEERSDLDAIVSEYDEVST